MKQTFQSAGTLNVYVDVSTWGFNKIHGGLANNLLQMNTVPILLEGFYIFALVPFHSWGSGSEHKTGQSQD